MIDKRLLSDEQLATIEILSEHPQRINARVVLPQLLGHIQAQAERIAELEDELTKLGKDL